MTNNNNLNQNTTDIPKEQHLFPVVGVGASAGGLEAFSIFVKSLPTETGLAFILIQHLDPHHESSLSILLRKMTSLSVEEVMEGLEISPNHIYVIPPNHHMTISGNILHLTPRANAPEPFLPINHFFDSLAVSRKENAVGIIFSGTGSDGTEGLEAIKDAGGLTFAQDETSAKFNGMPQSAIKAGAVDFILPPGAVIEQLLRAREYPSAALATREDTIFNEKELSFNHIITLLRTRFNVDFSAYRDTTIKRRIMRRMAVYNIETLAEYAELLERTPDEIDTLYHELLINVTSFFRDPEVFETLKNTVFPTLLKTKNSGSSFRIWVPGCSTGQEAYSLAMILLECLDKKKDVHLNIQIFATDLSDLRALEKAREGFYPDTIEKEVSPERLSRFFVKERGGYRISQSIREMCLIARHNVAADPPFSRVDLISCRNLLIYLAPSLQRRVIQTFHYALIQEGYLVLGAAETIGGFTDIFGALDKKHHIYLKKTTAARQYLHFSTEDYQTKFPVAPPALQSTTSTRDWFREADRIVLSHFAPTGVLINEDFTILQFRGRTSPYLEVAPGEPSHNLLKMASEGLFPTLRSAIDECRKQNIPVHREGVRIRRNNQMHTIDVHVFPVNLRESVEHCYLVLFEERTPTAVPVVADDNVAVEEGEALQLRQELVSMHEYLQSIVEQKDAINEELKSAIEEILSTNEELQSTNEEMETAKEELQSVNEELTTVNEQLDFRNKELSHLNEELQKSTDYALAIVDTVREPLLVLNANLYIVTANRAFYKTFEVTPEETLDHFLWDLGNHQWDIPQVRQLLEKILPQKTVMQDFAVSAVFPKIGRKIMLLNARRVLQKNGDDPLILLAIEDVTESKRMENDLKQSATQLSEIDHRKDQFLATLAHELRNPLAPISNALALISLPNADDATKEEAHQTIGRQVTQLIRLVDDLLDVSRITNGKIDLHKDAVKLEELVRNAVEISTPLIEKAKHELSVSIPESLWVDVDSVRMAQVISNVLNNAAKYTPQGGHIWLSAEAKELDLTIRIKDDGIGMSADLLPHIFDMFSQVDSSIERAQGGMGIGLALVKTLVELHGGTITVMSDGAGKGTLFTLWFPQIIIRRKVKALSAAKDKPTPSPQQKGKYVLVVDDNAPSANTIGKLVKLLGHQATIAYDGPTAIALAKKFQPDLILLDIGLPEMNGYEVCRAMRLEPSLKEVVIAAQTGWDQAEHRRLSKEAGFDLHLVKPVRLATLKELLDSLPTLGNRQLAKETIA